MKDFNKQLDEIRTQVIDELKNIGDFVLFNKEAEDENDLYNDKIYDLPVIRTINKYDQIVWFAVNKISLIDNLVIFDCIEREDKSTRQFTIKDVPLDELIDIYDYIQYELQNA
ncbi:hypothetical protein EBU24_01285 [bacterium]|nr:hypothetical protein [bacterium]